MRFQNTAPMADRSKRRGVTAVLLQRHFRAVHRSLSLTLPPLFTPCVWTQHVLGAHQSTFASLARLTCMILRNLFISSLLSMNVSNSS